MDLLPGIIRVLASLTVFNVLALLFTVTRKLQQCKPCNFQVQTSSKIVYFKSVT